MNNYQCSSNGRILVTGGLGAIGTTLIKALINYGRDVVVYDWKYYNTKGISQGIKIVNGDIRDYKGLSKLLSRENITGIVHLAAISQVGFSENNRSLCSSVNIGGTSSLIRAIEKSGKMPWVVNCSSREVYGEPINVPVNEYHPLHPVNTYGKSKALAENILEYYTSVLGFNAITLRPSNVYGSIYDLPERMVPRFITNALAGEHIEVYGGDQVLDLLHISDAIDGIVRAIMLLERMTCHGYYDVFNLATGAPHSLNDVISLVSLYVGRDIDTVRLEPRSFDVKRYIGDTIKASEKLGFVARTTLEEGIPATIDLYKTCMYELGHKSLTSTSHEGLVYRGAVN